MAKTIAIAASLWLAYASLAQAQFYVWQGGRLIMAQANDRPDSITLQLPKAKGEAPLAEDAVDLGLSVQWAPLNLGALSATDAGDYFAWGEGAPKDDYCWTTYRWTAGRETVMSSDLKKYNDEDGKVTLDATDDPVTTAWGGEWRMPTRQEWSDLHAQCHWAWKGAGQWHDNPLPGYLICKKAGTQIDATHCIFLPASGNRDGTDSHSVGIHGFYWSAERDEYGSVGARYLYFSREDVYPDDFGYRYDGFTIRPVRSLSVAQGKR